MDVETEPANKNDTTREQIKTVIDVTPPDPPKDTHNHKNSRSKRSSRSRTPQKKQEDPKILHVTLKKVGEEVNGKEPIEESVEEPVKLENGNNVGDEEKISKVEAVKSSENGEPAKIESVRESTSETENDHEKPVETNNGTKEDISAESQTESIKITKQDSKETVEMDPLVISDEADPELQFLEENSDKDSGKGSPLLTRCITRRSYTRNIPTPKTPKLAEPETDSEKNSVVDQSEEICNLPNDIAVPKSDSLNETKESLDTPNISTKVEVGSDATRLNFTAEANNSSEQDLSYLNSLRDKGLSARRPIRGADDYRKRVLKNTQNKSDLNIPYEQISTGIKRKNRSMTPEETKKFRIDSPGYGRFFFKSPLESLRNKFRSDLESSTPELLGYKDEMRNLHYNDNFEIEKVQEAEEQEKKSWCSLM